MVQGLSGIQPLVIGQRPAGTDPTGVNRLGKQEALTQQEIADMVTSLAGDASGLDETVKGKLTSLLRLMDTRSNLVSSLPDAAKQQAVQILREAAITPGQFASGLAQVAQQLKQTARELLQLAASLEQAAVLAEADMEILQKPLSEGPQLSPRQTIRAVQHLEQAVQEILKPETSPEIVAGALKKAAAELLKERSGSLAVSDKLLTRLAQTVSTSQPCMQNPETRTIIRQLAALLLTEIAPEQGILPQHGAKQTQDAFQQSAKRQDTILPPTAWQMDLLEESLPELHRLWSAVKTLDIIQWRMLEPAERTKAAATMKKLAQTFMGESAPQGETKPAHTLLSCSVPLYFGEHPVAYPAYIHIYQQREECESGRMQFETWLRIVLQTENMGPADLIFRLYEGNKLDVRIGLASQEAVHEMAQIMPELRTALEACALDIKKLDTVKTK